MIDGGDIYIVCSYMTAYLGLFLYGFSLILSLRRLRAGEAHSLRSKSGSTEEAL